MSWIPWAIQRMCCCRCRRYLCLSERVYDKKSALRVWMRQKKLVISLFSCWAWCARVVLHTEGCGASSAESVMSCVWKMSFVVRYIYSMGIKYCIVSKLICMYIRFCGVCSWRNGTRCRDDVAGSFHQIKFWKSDLWSDWVHLASFNLIMQERKDAY